jgi:hypothetical protein
MIMNNSFLKKAVRGALVVGAAGSLAACGGSDDSSGTLPPTTGSTDPTMPPVSASASPEGFIAFLKTVVVTQPDAGIQLDVANFSAPISDTTEPDPTI